MTSQRSYPNHQGLNCPTGYLVGLSNRKVLRQPRPGDDGACFALLWPPFHVLDRHLYPLPYPSGGHWTKGAGCRVQAQGQQPARNSKRGVKEEMGRGQGNSLLNVFSGGGNGMEKEKTALPPSVPLLPGSVEDLGMKASRFKAH